MSLHGKYYLCVGGWVISPNDQDTYYIPATRLPSLYKVNPGLCMYTDPERESPRLDQRIEVDPLDVDDLIQLHPSQTGVYKLPDLLVLPLDTTVVAIIRQYRDSRDGSALPILADALQDAGWGTPEQEVFLRRLRTGRPFINLPLCFSHAISAAAAMDFARLMRDDPEFRKTQELRGFKLSETDQTVLWPGDCGE